MATHVFHFKRHLSGTWIVDGATYTLASGWYDLLDLIATMYNADTGAEIAYNGTTNRLMCIAGTLTCTGTVAHMLGNSDVSASYCMPGDTWAPGQIDYSRDWGVGTAGKRIWDTDSKISLNGRVWAIAKNVVNHDVLRFNLIEREKIINDASKSTHTATWEEVWDPSRGIQFRHQSSDDPAGLSKDPFSMTSTWGDTNTWTVKNPSEVDQGAKLQFADEDTYYQISIPVIGNGNDIPVIP